MKHDLKNTLTISNVNSPIKSNVYHYLYGRTREEIIDSSDLNHKYG